MADQIIEDAQVIDEPKVRRTAMVYMVDGKSFETSLPAGSLVQHIAYNNPRVVSLNRPNGGDIHLVVNNISYIEDIVTEEQVCPWQGKEKSPQ